MADYTKFISLAQRLIAKRGRLISLVKLGTPVADPLKPWNGAGAPSDELEISGVPAVFLSTSDTSITTIVKDTDLLKRASNVALVAPHPDGDLRNMTVLVDRGVRCKIEWVQLLEPGDEVCLYVFGVAR